MSRRFEKWLKPGDIMLIYVIMYSIGRSPGIPALCDSSQIGGINFNQTFVAVAALVSGVLLFLNHRVLHTNPQ